MFHGISIRVAIIGAVCLSMALCTLLGGILVWQIDVRLHNAAAETVMNYTRMVDALRRQWISDNDTLMRSIVTRDVLQQGDGFSSAQCEASLRRFASLTEQISNIAVALPNGKVICATNPAFYTFSQIERGYFVDALHSSGVVEGAPIRSVTGNIMVVPLAYAVRDKSGTPQLVVTIGRTSQWFQSIGQTLDLPASIHIEILDQRGETIAAYPAIEHPFPVELRNQFMHLIDSDRSGVISADGNFRDGEQRVYAMLPLPKETQGGAILVSLPQKMLQETFEGFVFSVAAIMLAGFLLVSVMVLWLLRHLIGNPMIQLVQGVRDIATGAREWDSREIRGCAEIEELSRSLERTLKSLEQQEEHIQEQADILMRSNEDLQGFAYGISHDLREPLRTVSSFAQLLERRCGDTLNHEGQEFLAFITEGVARMSRMLDGLLEFSRVRTRGQTMTTANLSLPIENALKSLSLMIEENHAVVKTHDLCPVFGDQEQIARVFQNLISNAIKFAKPNTPIRIQISASPLPNGMVEVEVSDNGSGMSEEGRDKIFILFHRLVPRDSVPGDGLGLALCKRIVERHGGCIWVESLPGSGSVFHFTLPRGDTEIGQSTEA